MLNKTRLYVQIFDISHTHSNSFTNFTRFQYKIIYSTKTCVKGFFMIHIGSNSFYDESFDFKMMYNKITNVQMFI